jgi:FxsC-like protein
MLYFFLSCAPDEDDIFVHRLHRDLSAEITRRIGAEPQQVVGYLDDSGTANWPSDARTALGTCQTFIALWSAKYLSNDRCGRCWGIFADRLRDDRSDGDRNAEAMIPVIWSAADLPDNVLAEEDLDVRPHRTPNGDDLRVLMRLRSHRAAYRAFVASLAHRVVETAHTRRLPPAQPAIDVDGAADPFAVRRARGGDGHEAAKVYVVVAAGTREQMRTVRNDLRFYGLRREDWAPYQPVASQSLAARARGIVSDRRLQSEVVPIESVPEWLREGSRRDILVLLVDAWATRLDHLGQALREIGLRDDAAVAVLVPANRDDQETTAHRVELRREVLETFPGRASWRDSLFHIGVGSPDDFDADLSVAIAAAQRRAYRPGSVDPSRGKRVRPVLEGP